MSLSYASLLRPWRSLPKIMGFYAVVGLAATAAVILVNGIVSPANRGNEQLPYDEVIPTPPPAPIETPLNLVAAAVGSLDSKTPSRSALLFALVPLETATTIPESAHSDDQRSGRETIIDKSMIESWTMLAQLEASLDGWNAVARYLTNDSGAALASYNDRYSKFPSSVDLSRSYPSGLFVTLDDVPRLAGALQAARAANARAGVFVTSSDTFLMDDLRHRMDSR